MIEARIGQTKSGAQTVELWDGEKMILKAYASPDGNKIRIVLPELVSYSQTLIDPEHHFLEFERKVTRRK